jgi:light-regulated signal transduction histidine kinase (bacteriophytochrome)
MTSRVVSAPPFGTADLSNCEREQIQFAGSIQPHGALLLCREPSCVIVQHSANAPDFLGLTGELVGRRLEEIDGDLTDAIAPELQDRLNTRPVAVRCRIGTPRRAVIALVHRPAGGGLLIELEPAGETVDVGPGIEAALQAVLGATSLAGLCDEVARSVKTIAGYDRVMIYRFDDEGHGQVFAEQREPALEPYLGNRYPASDIPQIARRLYERNRVRLLVDVGFEPVPLSPKSSPITGAELDMSLCVLRSPSPLHVQYLRNMEVRATLVVSIMVGGQLWGLISCHHYQPYFVPATIRAACEFLAEALATRITALENFAEAQAEMSARRLEHRMLDVLSREGNWKIALFDTTQLLLAPVRAGGAALVIDDEVTVAGDVPATQDIRAIAGWLDERDDHALVVTAALSRQSAGFESIVGSASGVLAVSLAESSGAYLIWMRPEQVRTVTWGGDPTKPVSVGDTPGDLSPRRSFAKWHEVMRCQSEPWTKADIAAARLIGAMVSDVILQSRSVKMLIAHDQLEMVRRDVVQSSQPVIIADVSGRVILVNNAFSRLFAGNNQPLDMLGDLPELFAHPAQVADRLQALQAHHLSWRGEVAMKGDGERALPLLIRADPIFASADRVLGFVLMVSDLTAQKVADTARSVFQDGIIEHNRLASGLIASSDDLMFQSLLKSMFENAQLAALEITDRADQAKMSVMLDSVRESVTRTTAVLRNLFAQTR